MKVANFIRKIYDENEPRYSRLSEEVCDLLKDRVEERGWFFTHRVKALPSFALKLETGRVSDPKALDDFFACTIVVQNLALITDAEILVREHYEPEYRKPEKDDQTSKETSDFRFDDLRLYVSRRPHVRGLDDDLTGLLFEVQIKTMLQYAWSIATHDLIYKTDTISWPKERIAFQVKAMLEHAEIAIAEAALMASSPSVSKNNYKSTNILKIIPQLENFWPNRLPGDRKRLAENILNVLNSASIQPNQLSTFIEEEQKRIGSISLDLSPYAFVVQALAQSKDINFEKLFNRLHVKTCLLAHREMDLPPWMKRHKRILYISE